MAENWTYLGSMYSTNTSYSNNSPVTTVSACGWAERASGDVVSPSSFVVKWDDLQDVRTLLLWCTIEERALLLDVTSQGYRVWVTGMLLMTGRTSILSFERANVWSVLDGGTPLSEPPVTVARCLWQSTRNRGVLEWGAKLQGIGVAGAHDQSRHIRSLDAGANSGGRKNHSLHPLACESIRSYAKVLTQEENSRSRGDVATLLSDILLAADREASIRTKQGKTYCTDTEQIGDSAFGYDVGRDCVRDYHGISNFSSSSSGKETPTSVHAEVTKKQPKGYLVCGDDATTLLCVAAAISAADREVCWQRGGRKVAETLVVTPRHALHTTLSIFQPLCAWARISHQGPHVEDDERDSDVQCVEDLEAKVKLTITTIDSLRRHSKQYGARSYCRCIFVDWPRCCSAKRSGVPSGRWGPSASEVDSDVTIGLALTQDVLPLLGQPRFETDFMTLLGTASTRDGGVPQTSALMALLESQVVRLYGAPRQKALARYSIREGPRLTEKELSLLVIASKTRSRNMRSLYGEVMPPAAGVKTASVKDASTIESFFQRRVQNYVSTQFKRSSYAGPPSDCPVCFDVDPDCVLSCGHYLCYDCYQRLRATTPTACPLCKSAIATSGAVRVETLTTKTEMGIGFVDFLSTILRVDAAKKKIVIGSYGEIHEALASALRLRDVKAMALAGNGKQTFAVVEAFEEGSISTLIIDPIRTDISWLRFTGVEEAFVILPLESGKLDPCCAVRFLLNAVAESSSERKLNLFFVRRQGDRTQIPQDPACLTRCQDVSSCQCPFLVQNKTQPHQQWREYHIGPQISSAKARDH